MSTEAIKEELGRFPFFSIMDPAEVAEVAEIMILLGMKPGQTIIDEGEPGDACFFVIEGKVDIIKKVDEGEELLLGTLEAPSLFGELSLITNQERTATVVARTGVRLIKLPKYPFHQMILAGRIAAYKVVYRIATALGYRLARIDDEILRILKETDRSLEEKIRMFQESKRDITDKWPF